MEKYNKEKRFQFGFDGRELVLFIAGISVICLLFFIFGITVGKGRAVREAGRVPLLQKPLADEERREPRQEAAEVKELLRPAAEEGESVEGSRAAQKPKKEEDAEAVGLTFYDTLPNKEEAKADKASAPDKPEAASTQERSRKVTGSVEKKETATMVRAEVKEPAPVTVESRVTGEGLYAVQISSFRDWGNAMALKKRLIVAGYRAFVTQSESNGGGARFRVRVGDLRGRKKAEELARKIGLQENLPAFVVRAEGRGAR